MTAGVGAGLFLDFEPFRAAVTSALVSGALSMLIPWLVSPTATLAALALAAWVSQQRRRGSLTRQGIGLGPAVALGILGAASIGFLELPGLLSSLKGPLLAAGLLPLLLAERQRARHHAPFFSRS